MEIEKARARLEEFRTMIDNGEDLSYGELVELQSLAPYVGDGDVQMLEWAGVSEDEARAAGRL
jgi:hypothetical protein